MVPRYHDNDNYMPSKPRGGFHLEPLLELADNAQLIYVGSLACTRHRGFEMGKLMREKRMAVLCPSATDFSTGKYINQISDAIIELARGRNAKNFVLIYGCQCALLSTDFDLIRDELATHDINLIVHEHCHLCDIHHGAEVRR
ncbi:MAG TPA: hypothetical protein GXZ52_03445 [Clostridiales bacterium]|nr:hypothetical protein [Clostridiales bacterium]